MLKQPIALVTFFSSILIVMTCGANLPAPAPLASIAISPVPEPNWVTLAYPKQGETISLTQYVEDDWKRLGEIVIVDVSNSICFDIWTWRLIQPGDFWDAEDVMRRTEVKVDGVGRDDIKDTLWSDLMNLGLLDPPDYKTVVASVGGSYGWCVFAPLGVGLHQAEIRFTKSSNEILSFIWTFTITDSESASPDINQEIK